MSVDLDKPGELRVRQGDSTGWLSIIERADPVIKFAPYVLVGALEGGLGWPACHLIEMRPPIEGHEHFCMVPDGEHCWMGWTITVADASQKFVYVIKRYDAERHMWIGAWPD